MSTVIHAKPYTIEAPLTNASAENIDADFTVLFQDLLALSEDLPTGTTIGGAYIYRVGGTDVAMADGGTGASLTASAGAVVYSSSTALALSAVGSSGQMLRSAGTGTPIWSTPTWPNSATSGKILYGDGTNISLSTPTFPASASATANKIIVSDGTNWVASTPLFSQTPTSGTYLRGDGTNWITSTLTIPNAATSGDILKASGANAYASAAPEALTKTDDTNVTLTLGGTPTTALVNAASLTLGWTGTLGLTRGGTAASLTAVNGGIAYSTASALALSAAGSSGQLLRSGGAGAPTWSTATFPAAAGAANTILRSDGTNWVASTPTYSQTPTSGTYFRGDGTNWITSTLVLPNSATQYCIPYATSANTWSESTSLKYNATTLSVNGPISSTAYTSNGGALESGRYGRIESGVDGVPATHVAHNLYLDNGTLRYATSDADGAGSNYLQYSGLHVWRGTPTSGTAGNEAVTLVILMNLSASGLSWASGSTISSSSIVLTE